MIYKWRTSKETWISRPFSGRLIQNWILCLREERFLAKKPFFYFGMKSESASVKNGSLDQWALVAFCRLLHPGGSRGRCNSSASDFGKGLKEQYSFKNIYSYMNIMWNGWKYERFRWMYSIMNKTKGEKQSKAAKTRTFKLAWGLLFNKAEEIRKNSMKGAY